MGKFMITNEKSRFKIVWESYNEKGEPLELPQNGQVLKFKCNTGISQYQYPNFFWYLLQEGELLNGCCYGFVYFCGQKYAFSNYFSILSYI